MDVRRELDLINKHFRKHHEVANESVIWYEFIPLGSSSAGSLYDDVYDEGVKGSGGRNYGLGIVLPVLLVSESEDQRRSIPEGRQVVQTIDMFIPIKDMREAGITAPWEYRGHLNDMFVYDGRYYQVFDYKVRGRLKDDVFVLIQGIETYINQEFTNDPGLPALVTTNYPWPAQLPSLG